MRIACDGDVGLRLPLKGGDVILSIGGRKPTSPSHAMRILRSYEPGETVALDIMRKQKRVTVSWKVPERGSGGCGTVMSTRTRAGFGSCRSAAELGSGASSRLAV